MEYDVIVVGGGPGGATAAGLAASAGLKVLMVDRAVFPRDKICGDAISGKSIDVLKKLDLHTKVLERPSIESGGILFSGPAGDEVEIPFAMDGTMGGFVCAREHFDDLVVRRAVELGAELLEGVAVEGLLRDGDRVTGVHIKSSPREVHAPLVIGADGAYSVVAKELGMTQLVDDHYYAGVRSYYEGLAGFRGRNFIELHFVDEAIPGYFWIFPMAGGRANVGLGTLSRHIKQDGIHLKALLDEIVGSSRFAERFKGTRRLGKVVGWGMPLGSAPRKMAGDGWMLVGDAASLIDPFTGEGIGNAMVSGMRAAEWALHAHAAGDFSESFLHGYDRAVHDTLDDELRLSYKLQKLEKWRWLLNTVIRKAGRAPEIA
ncbi:MAG: geranylgeranyl reductase family protein, partial [Rhodothermales bacterium]